MEQQEKNSICKTVFHIKEMDCPSEENLVRIKIQPFDNEISGLDFDLSKRQVIITHNRNVLEQIVKSIDELESYLTSAVLNSLKSISSTGKPDTSYTVFFSGL